jgi:hypothetical protein
MKKEMFSKKLDFKNIVISLYVKCDCEYPILSPTQFWFSNLKKKITLVFLIGAPFVLIE